jgi:hypothetical protein
LTCNSLEAETDSQIIKKFIQDLDPDPKLPSNLDPDPKKIIPDPQDHNTAELEPI